MDGSVVTTSAVSAPLPASPCTAPTTSGRRAICHRPVCDGRGLAWEWVGREGPRHTPWYIARTPKPISIRITPTSNTSDAMPACQRARRRGQCRPRATSAYVPVPNRRRATRPSRCCVRRPLRCDRGGEPKEPQPARGPDFASSTGLPCRVFRCVEDGATMPRSLEEPATHVRPGNRRYILRQNPAPPLTVDSKRSRLASRRTERRLNVIRHVSLAPFHRLRLHRLVGHRRGPPPPTHGPGSDRRMPDTAAAPDWL